MQKFELLEMVLILVENEISALSEEGILPDKENQVPPPGGEDPAGLTSDLSSDSLSDTGEPSADMAGGSPGDPGAPDLELDDPSDMGGGIGGGGGGGLAGSFGGGGGGGGLGGGMDDPMGGSDEDPQDSEDTKPSPIPYHPFKDAKTTEDKLRVILDVSERLATETQDPQKIFKAVKGLIQNGFSKPQAASKIISDLFNTNDPVLQQVSKRLSLFALGL